MRTLFLLSSFLFVGCRAQPVKIPLDLVVKPQVELEIGGATTTTSVPMEAYVVAAVALLVAIYLLSRKRKP